MRRLALFLDGTRNEQVDNTNVWRLRSLCAKQDAYGVGQLIYYDAGVGTRFGEKTRGSVFGYGIDQNVARAYQWLVENYEDGDAIFIFGFSRGAFTARSLAGMISICGLAIAGGPLGVGQLYARYRENDRGHSIRKLFEERDAGKTDFTVEENWLLRYSRPVEIEMIGVWDTVGSLGNPLSVQAGPGKGRHAFLDVNLRRDMKHVFHALAIDEHRANFQPTFWTQPIKAGPGVVPKETRDLAHAEQRWFVGAHANVGGGYFSDFLPQLSLRWILEKAKALGLAFRAEIDVDQRAQLSKIADSYGEFGYGFYKRVSRPYQRPIGADTPVRDGHFVKIVNEAIDPSVFDRWRADAAYRPANLADWARRRGIDPARLTTAVRADDGAPIDQPMA